MGRFFTSTQIYNPKQLDRDGFKADFCKKMKKEGYEVCEADCAELSYVLAFADNCKWVTISSEAYEQGNRTAQADTARIAKMLGTYCVNTNVIDSDCAMLDLYDDKGKKADTAIMGRADDYLGDDIPAPAKAVWEKFLSADSTWEKFISVVQGDYVFVEDGLSELAPVIEMDSGNILFEYDDANENNENFCYLSFRKASSKKEKKLTLNAAFKQIIGETLEPYGFKIIKGRHPYIVRVINNEILHIITFCPESPEYPEDKAFSIMGGVATIYRKKITFDLSPKQNRNWLTYLQRFYVLQTQDCNINNAQRLFKSCYYSQNYDSMINALKEANRRMQTYILPVFDKITDIDSCLEYCRVFLKPCNHLMCTEICSYYPDDDESFLYFVSKYWQDKQPEFLNNFINDANFHEWVLAEIDKRKKFNTELLKSYGIDLEKPLPKKEKKLTLNSAFVKVFGEALEPLGFVKIKSKHPYFVRVVNEEILHIITYKTEQAQYPEDKAFNILCGVATIYRQQIDLNAGIRANYNWLRNSIADFYAIPLGNEYDNYFRQTISRFNYFSTIESSLINVMKEASILTEKYVIPVINEINTLEKCIKFLKQFKLPITTNSLNSDLSFDKGDICDEGLLYIKTNDEKLREKWRKIVDGEKEVIDDIYVRVYELYKFFVNPEYNNAALEELKKRRKNNTEILKSYGIDLENPQPKKEKKLTLNSAFVKVFGEALEPLGFVKIKSKHPYFVRVVNEEILHIITFDKDYPGEFSVFGGIATVYRKKIDFDQDVLANLNAMNDTAQFYAYSFKDYSKDDTVFRERSYCYLPNDNDSIEQTFIKALDQAKQYILPVLDSIVSLRGCIDHYMVYHSPIINIISDEYDRECRNEGLLYFKIDDHSDMIREFSKSLEVTKKMIKKDRHYDSVLAMRCADSEEYRMELISKRDAIYNDPVVYQQVMAELERRKQFNIEKLKSYGITLE